MHDPTPTTLVDRPARAEGYTHVLNQAAPVLISLKGASAAGKSSIRPMVKRLMRDSGIEPDGYATISPDVWRRMLLDYEALGEAYKVCRSPDQPRGHGDRCQARSLHPRQG